MKENVKSEISSRIAKIQDRIVEANSKYREYLSKGASATVNDYLDLKRAVASFYRDEFVPVSTPKGYDDRTEAMYASFKNHKMLACRRALKEMNKKLERSGISAEDMIAFSDPLAEEMATKISVFENACSKVNINQNGSGDVFSHCFDVVDKYLHDYRRMKLSDLEILELPTPEKVIEKGRADFEQVLAAEVEKYKKKITAINPEFEEYQVKGESATFEDYEKISHAVFQADFGLKYKSAAKKVALEELAKDGVAIVAEMNKSGSYHLRTIYEDKAASIIVDFESGVRKLISRDDEYVLGKCKAFVETLKKMPMGKLIKEDLPSPSYFVKMAKEQQAKADEVEPKQKQ